MPRAQASPVEIQDLNLGGAPLDERKQTSRQWVLQYDVSGQWIQAIEGQAHAHRLAVQEPPFCHGFSRRNAGESSRSMKVRASETVAKWSLNADASGAITPSIKWHRNADNEMAP